MDDVLCNANSVMWIHDGLPGIMNCNIPILGKEFKNLAHEIMPLFHAFFHLCIAHFQVIVAMFF
jgi:hypothetical protein